MKVFISPPELSDWSFGVGQLETLIANEVDEILISRSVRSLEWVWNSLGGHLSEDRTTVVLDGDIELSVQFALWYRRQVPESQKLVFFDEAYSHDVELGLMTTQTELISPFLIE